MRVMTGFPPDSQHFLLLCPSQHYSLDPAEICEITFAKIKPSLITRFLLTEHPSFTKVSYTEMFGFSCCNRPFLMMANRLNIQQNNISKHLNRTFRAFYSVFRLSILPHSIRNYLHRTGVSRHGGIYSCVWSVFLGFWTHCTWAMLSNFVTVIAPHDRTHCMCLGTIREIKGYYARRQLMRFG